MPDISKKREIPDSLAEKRYEVKMMDLGLQKLRLEARKEEIAHEITLLDDQITHLEVKMDDLRKQQNSDG